jgi:hypothetical protein
MSKTAKYSLLAALSLLAAVLIFAPMIRPGKLGMQCQKLEQEQVDAHLNRFEQTPRYVPGSQGRASVLFQFSLSPEIVGESRFIIFSNRSRAAVYSGPYQVSVSVPIDSNLSADKGYDQLEFRLITITEKQFCTWINERGEPYWHSGAQIAIEFLQEPTTDDTGLPKDFDVTIR